MQEDLEFQNELSKLLHLDSTTLQRIHIDESCSSDSEPDGRLLDEDYLKNQPPPCDYNIIKDHVVKIGTESIGIKKKKKKKKKTKKSSELVITNLSVESSISPLSQASNIPESDTNIFNTLLNISDDSPADKANMNPLDYYNDTETVSNVQCKDDSSNFAFDFDSKVGGSWETAVNKKSRKIQGNEDNEKSCSLVLETIILNTSHSNEDNLFLTYSSNIKNDTYLFPEPVPIDSSSMIGTTSSEIYEVKTGCKKKAKKKKKQRKHQFSEFIHSTNVPLANAAYMNNTLVSSPNTCHEVLAQNYEVRGSESVITESNNSFLKHQQSNEVNDWFENTHTCEGIERSPEIWDTTTDSGSISQKTKPCNICSGEKMYNERFYMGIPKEKCTIYEPENCVCNKPNNILCMKPSLTGKTMKLSLCSDESVRLKSHSGESKLKELDDVFCEKALNHSSTSDYSNQDISIFDCELHSGRKIQDSCLNITKALSIADGTINIEKNNEILKTEHKDLHRDEFQMNNIPENFIPLTPTDNIDTTLQENNIKRYNTCTQMQPEKEQTSKRKCKRLKKKANSDDTHQYIIANNNINIPTNTTNSQYIDLHFISNDSYNQPSNEVDDLFEDVLTLNKTHRDTEGVVNSDDLGTLRQSEGKKVKKKSKKKSKKGCPIKESDAQDICIFNESDFPPLPSSIKSTRKEPTSVKDNSISHNATMPEPAPSNLFCTAKDKYIKQKPSILGSDVNNARTDDDTGNLETEIIRFFQSNIPYDFTANILSTSHQYVDLARRDNTKKYADNNVDKIYEQISYSQTNLFKSASNDSSPIPVKSDCAQNVLLNAITSPLPSSNVYDQHGLNMKLSDLSKILASHTEIVKSHDNISNLSIMIPGNLFQYIQKDQKCQSNILDFLIAGSGLPRQTSLFFYNETYETGPNMKGSLYLDEASQNNLNPVTYEIAQKTYHSLEGVALTATTTNESENLDKSFVELKCKHVLSSESDDGIIRNVIDTNTYFGVMTNDDHYTVNLSNPFYLKNDPSTDTIPSLLDVAMTDKRNLNDLLNILAMNIQLIKIHDNVSHVSVMVPANLCKQIQSDQKCQNAILEFLTAGDARLNQRTSWLFYDEIDEKGSVGDDNMADYFYLEGKLYKKTAYDYNDLYSPRSSSHKTNIESATDSISCFFNNISTVATTSTEDLNDCCTNKRIKDTVSSENNEDQLCTNINTCFDTLPKPESTQPLVNLYSTCSLDKIEPICDKSNLSTSTTPFDNIQRTPDSETSSSYPTIIVENVVNLSLYCLFHLVKDII
nr:unnamed protein product [Callosobruchus analis]